MPVMYPVGGIGTNCMQCEEGDYFQFAASATIIDFRGVVFVVQDNAMYEGLTI